MIAKCKVSSTIQIEIYPVDNIIQSSNYWDQDESEWRHTKIKGTGSKQIRFQCTQMKRLSLNNTLLDMLHHPFQGERNSINGVKCST